MAAVGPGNGQALYLFQGTHNVNFPSRRLLFLSRATGNAGTVREGPDAMRQHNTGQDSTYCRGLGLGRGTQFAGYGTVRVVES